MDRCALSIEYHRKGFNCAQSVLAACADLTGLSARDSLAVASGFGKGIGGGTEICGALSGAVMALSLLAPNLEENDAWGKQRSYLLSKKVQKMFFEKFGSIRCDDLLAGELALGDRFPTAKRLGLDKPCEVFITTAVELVEELLPTIPQKE